MPDKKVEDLIAKYESAWSGYVSLNSSKLAPNEDSGLKRLKTELMKSPDGEKYLARANARDHVQTAITLLNSNFEKIDNFDNAAIHKLAGNLKPYLQTGNESILKEFASVAAKAKGSDAKKALRNAVEEIQNARAVIQKNNIEPTEITTGLGAKGATKLSLPLGVPTLSPKQLNEAAGKPSASVLEQAQQIAAAASISSVSIGDGSQPLAFNTSAIEPKEIS